MFSSRCAQRTEATRGFAPGLACLIPIEHVKNSLSPSIERIHSVGVGIAPSSLLTLHVCVFKRLGMALNLILIQNSMAFPDYLLAVVLPLVLLAVAGMWKGWIAKSRPPFPPGPKPRFMMGNFLDIPTTMPWITYTEWGKRYGAVVHAQVFRNHILIVNSVKAATDLFERRARIYSDRPTMPMILLMEWDFNFTFMPHGEKWRQARQYRRLFHQHFRRDAVVAYRPIQLRKIHDLLRGLLSTPEDFVEHIKTLTAAIIMATVYGYDIKPKHDRFVYLAEESIKKLGETVHPGTFAVNTFPFLRYLPSWFPGCGFHRFARDTSELVEEMKNAPYDFVRQNMRDGVGRSSVLRELLERNDAQGGSSEQETMIKDVTAIAYAGAADTTSSALVSFVLAMALNPEVAAKAQNEIDGVIGFGRLPGFEDRSALPYCEAVFREVMRWRPIAPLGVAHATSEDDIYEGYFIPKGTMVLPNIWAMVHDESMYPNPDQFNPERFLNADGQLNADDNILKFGFGRRTCAGRHAADAVVWATIVSVLSTFDIAKAKNETGQVIEIEPAFSDGLVSHPKPFKCAITPRRDVEKQLMENMTDV
ncbi:O-methylsterigmatocystin oxidoreductase [Mycena venus]|uniref:O-methylsterigmatocystin oxidoreductase n=1 Tax=Mycena venus TaxID=2733690 RepID=A0A8H6YLV5_9AGAR|nr:O-methylsterigmatocystin oxidoreductase [Mycena venus]